jgi:Tfp pilus assembly protein PilP
MRRAPSFIAFVVMTASGVTVAAQVPSHAAPGSERPGLEAAVLPPADVVPAPPHVVAPLESQGYTYIRDGRRDPFVSLVRRGSDSGVTPGLRSAGLAGLGVAEITLKGTLESRGGYVGILQGADNRTYIVRAGDKLVDGTVRAIDADSMVILQVVSDPLSRERQREVRKLLRNVEEARP